MWIVEWEKKRGQMGNRRRLVFRIQLWGIIASGLSAKRFPFPKRVNYPHCLCMVTFLLNKLQTHFLSSPTGTTQMICQIVSSYLKMWQYFHELIPVVNMHTHWITIYEGKHIRYYGDICILSFYSTSPDSLCMKSIRARPRDALPCNINIFVIFLL